MKKRVLAMLCAVCLGVSMLVPAVALASQASTTLIDFDYITSAKTGNIFGISDSIEFTQTVENKAAENVVSKYSWAILNESGISVASYSWTETLTSKQTKPRNITIDNPGKYGIYTIHVSEVNYTVADPGTKYTAFYTEEFSVCISLAASDIDENFGINQSAVRDIYGDYTTAGSLIYNAGAKWNRESIMWEGIESTTEAGDFKLSSTTMSKVDTLLDSGIKILGTITGRHQLHGGTKDGGGHNPRTDDERAAFASMCAYVADKFKGKVDHFEIWNEWNHRNFNPTREEPETYAQLLKAAYTAIKAEEANPEATVIGCDVAGMDEDQIAWIRRVLDELNGETAMDAISVHCYDFTVAEGFPEMQFVKKVEALKALLEEYNLDIPIWLTEIGFNTRDKSVAGSPPACTKDVQLNSMVMLGAVNKAYGLFDKMMLYCLNDMSNESYIPANYGILNCWKRDYTERPEAKLVPNGAKPAYLGLAAMNHFIGGSATFRRMAKEARCYAFEFNNSNLGKKVILAINGGFNNNVTRNFNLGCANIEIYDKYGNLKDEMSSGTGAYTIDTYSEPIYIVGNFTNFDVSDPYIRLSASLNLEDNTVTISGNTSEPNDLVSVMVVTDGEELVTYDAGRVKYIAQTASDRNGDFSVQYVTDDLSGSYKIYANSERRRSKMVKDLVFTYTVPELTVTKNDTPVTAMSQLFAGNRPVIKLIGIDTTAESSPKVIVAQYKDDELINFRANSAAGDFTVLGQDFSTDFTVAEGTDKIKIMYWNMESISPLIATYEIN